MCQHRRQPDRRLVVKRRGWIDQLFRLRHQRILNALRRVAQAIHGPALQIIQIAFSVMVAHPPAAPFSEDQRRPVGDGEQDIDVGGAGGRGGAGGGGRGGGGGAAGRGAGGGGGRGGAGRRGGHRPG